PLPRLPVPVSRLRPSDRFLSHVPPNCLFLSCHGAHRDLHSFPTRRSSDLGGEKARLALAKLRMQKANLLILDEPTNHLDIDSKEILEAALVDFPGTIIFVSHDRYFINKIADKVVEMQKDGATVYLGDYDYYLDKKQEEAELERLQAEEKISKEANDKKLDFKEEKKRQSEKRKRERQITKLEKEIETLEEELALLEEKMTEPEVYENHEKALEYTNKTNEVKQDIEKLMEEWTLLQEE